MRCPHCGVAAIARTSITLAPTYREITYQCPVPECGFCWVASLEALRSLSPSGNPNPEVDIPPSTSSIVRRKFHADHDH
jgi:hypothetical protein